MSRTLNKSFYHYKLTKLDNENLNFGNSEYFLTNEDIYEKYGIPRTTIFWMIKNPNSKNKKHKFLIEKVKLHKESIDSLLYAYSDSSS